MSLFTEMSIVADERQMSSAPRDYARAPAEYRIVTCEQSDARRAEAETFVRKRFLRSHGAHVSTFMPTLLLLTDAGDELTAVAGFRCAAQEPLFLEKYLPLPIDQVLEPHAGTSVNREEILEVGNFAALDSRRAKILMSFMPAYFLEYSARWIVFTATAAIRGIVAAMGGRCVEVGTADGACVVMATG